MSTALARQFRELVGFYSSLQRRHIHDQGLPPQVRLLILLRNLGPVTQSELGRVAGLEKSWVSRVVDRFVENGLVKRVPLTSDRRCLQINLTPAGSKQARQVDVLLTDYVIRLLGDIPDDAQPALIDALTVLTQALHKKTDTGEV